MNIDDFQSMSIEELNKLQMQLYDLAKEKREKEGWGLIEDLYPYNIHPCSLARFAIQWADGTITEEDVLLQDNYEDYPDQSHPFYVFRDYEIHGTKALIKFPLRVGMTVRRIR